MEHVASWRHFNKPFALYLSWTRMCLHMWRPSDDALLCHAKPLCIPRILSHHACGTSAPFQFVRQETQRDVNDLTSASMPPRQRCWFGGIRRCISRTNSVLQWQSKPVISSPYLGAQEGSCWRKGSATATKDWCFLVQMFVAAVGNRPTSARPVLLPHNETHRKTRQAYSCT